MAAFSHETQKAAREGGLFLAANGPKKPRKWRFDSSPALDYNSRMNPEPLDPRQIERFRSMAPAEKWEIAKSLLETARRTRRAAIALRHRDWSSEQVERELAREFASART